MGCEVEQELGGIVPCRAGGPGGSKEGESARGRACSCAVLPVLCMAAWLHGLALGWALLALEILSDASGSRGLVASRAFPACGTGSDHRHLHENPTR